MKSVRFSSGVTALSLLVTLTGILVSQPGRAQVIDPGPPFPGLEPAVRIISPPNHAVFDTNEDIPILVYTRSDGVFTNVELYANGTNDLGDAVNLAITNRRAFPQFAPPTVMSPILLKRLTGLWYLEWSNPPAGSYALTAVARGTYEFIPSPIPGGAEPMYIADLPVSRTSAPVNITVLLSTDRPPAPTNIVSIVASDPIAIAGTNDFWIWPGLTNAAPAWTNWPPSASAITLCTNWGPKAAAFKVRRSGDDSTALTTALTVTYSIGGTASNGVDYVALPGNVTIAAGKASAIIPIVPIDSGSNTVPKTVILTLTPDTNTPPEYVIGVPPKAEAVIYYHWLRPLPLPWLVAGGGFHFNASGPDGAWFVVQCSPDFLNWTSLCTNQVFAGSVDFIDPAATNPEGFYRVLPLDGPTQ
jgi:hypothetical protein